MDNLDVCSPNSNLDAPRHSPDVLLVWSTLNSKTKSVHAHYDDGDFHHSQLLSNNLGAFLRTHDPNPDVKMLKARGPAHPTTRTLLAGRNRIQRSLTAL